MVMIYSHFLFLLSAIVISVTFAMPGDRNLTIVNQCSEVVRVGHTGGRCLMANEARFPATSGCPAGLTRNPRDNFCYWDIPTPAGGLQKLDLQPNETIVLTLSTTEQDCSTSSDVTQSLKWSGNIWGATGCNVGKRVCETGLCFAGDDIAQNGHCPTYRGPIGPLTRAEFTLQNKATDFYDITTIDGVNIPIEMKPTTMDGMSPIEAGQSGISADYWCGNPGGVMALDKKTLSGCSWNFNPTNLSGGLGDQSVHLILVAKSNDPDSPNHDCKQDSDCPQDQVCGTLQQLNDISGGPEPGLFPGKCGQHIGFWNANGICSWAEGISDPSMFPNNKPFYCLNSTGQGAGTNRLLYGCAGVYGISGYNCNAPNNQVCGCPDWKELNINAPPTSPCQCTNKVWVKNALPWVEWIKRACPTSYVFQYDDSSATFQCRNKDASLNNINTMGYTITFCPKPTKATETGINNGTQMNTTEPDNGTQTNTTEPGNGTQMNTTEPGNGTQLNSISIIALVIATLIKAIVELY